VVAALGFLLGAQSRLSSVLTPQYAETQRAKTEVVLAKAHIGIPEDTFLRVTGVLNLILVGTYLWSTTRQSAVVLGVLYLAFGAYLRLKGGLSIMPPCVFMALLILGGMT